MAPPLSRASSLRTAYGPDNSKSTATLSPALMASPFGSSSTCSASRADRFSPAAGACPPSRRRKPAQKMRGARWVAIHHSLRCLGSRAGFESLNSGTGVRRRPFKASGAPDARRATGRCPAGPQAGSEPFRQNPGRPPRPLSGRRSCSHERRRARSTGAQASSITSRIKWSPAALCQGALKARQAIHRNVHGKRCSLQFDLHHVRLPCWLLSSGLKRLKQPRGSPRAAPSCLPSHHCAPLTALTSFQPRRRGKAGRRPAKPSGQASKNQDKDHQDFVQKGPCFKQDLAQQVVRQRDRGSDLMPPAATGRCGNHAAEQGWRGCFFKLGARKQSGRNESRARADIRRSKPLREFHARSLDHSARPESNQGIGFARIRSPRQWRSWRLRRRCGWVAGDM